MYTPWIISHKSHLGFTLLELLIVIGILAILATVVALVLNPAELLKQTRDSNRLSDLKHINTALNLYQMDVASPSLGTSSTVYVSIPDTSATCANLGLPSLPTNWSYACKPEADFRKVDSTGWIPVNFTQISAGSPLSVLPVDPINTTSTGNYYTYVPGGSWVLTALFESDNYKMGGVKDKTSTDAGSYPELYEIGTNLSLHPVSRDPSLKGYWKFNELSGALYDSSGNNNNGTQSGGVTYGVAGKVGNALSFDGVDDFVDMGNSNAYDLAATNHTLAVWFLSPTRNSFDDDFARIFQRFTGGTPGQGYFIGMRSATGSEGKLILDKRADGGNHLSFNTSLRYDDNMWHYLVLTVNIASQIGTLYIDGISISTDSYTGNLINRVGENLRLGGQGTANSWKNFLDEVRIYHRALSAAEIAAIYNATK